MGTLIPVFRKALFALSLIQVPLLSVSQVSVTHIDQPADLQGKKGVVYVLPRTVIAVDVQVEATYRYRGPYADQAESMLGISDYIRQSGKEYEITEVSLRSFTEPDPAQYYFVQMEEKADRHFMLELGPGGIITSAVTIAKDAQPSMQEDLVEVFPYYNPSAVKQKVDTVRRIVTIDTVTVEKYLLRNTLVMQTDDEKAREAADMINVLKQDKYNILIGYQETAYEKEAMKYMVDRLESMEREYLKLFTGTTQSERFTLSFLYIPGTADEETLFYFSKDDGIVERGGEPVRIILDDVGMAGPLPDGPAAEGKTGIFYRVPGKAGVSVEYNGVSLTNKRMVINQVGKVLSLPSTAIRVSLDPETGNVRRAELRAP